MHILDPASLDVLIQKLETHPGGYVLLRKIADFGVRLDCVPAEALPVSRCGYLGRSLHLSELQFSHLQKGVVIPVLSPLHWSPLKFWHSAGTCLCQVFSLFECLACPQSGGTLWAGVFTVSTQVSFQGLAVSAKHIVGTQQIFVK